MNISLIGLLFVNTAVIAILYRSWVARFSVNFARVLRVWIPSHQTIKRFGLYNGALSLAIGVLFLAGLLGPHEALIDADDVKIGIAVESLGLFCAGVWDIFMSRRWARAAIAEGDTILGMKISERGFVIVAVGLGVVCICATLLVVLGVLPYEF